MAVPRTFALGLKSDSPDHAWPHAVQITPDKSMNFAHTIAAFTLPHD